MSCAVKWLIGGVAAIVRWRCIVSKESALLAKDYSWAISIVLGFVVVYLEAGFLMSFGLAMLSSFAILLPEYIADFGATWTTSDIIMELILGKEYVMPFFLIVSLSGGLILVRFRVSLGWS